MVGKLDPTECAFRPAPADKICLHHRDWPIGKTAPSAAAHFPGFINDGERQEPGFRANRPEIAAPGATLECQPDPMSAAHRRRR